MTGDKQNYAIYYYGKVFTLITLYSGICLDHSIQTNVDDAQINPL